METLCECAAFYLLATWFIGTCWTIRDWDMIIAENPWMLFFPIVAFIAVMLHIVQSPITVPQTIWKDISSYADSD